MHEVYAWPFAEGIHAGVGSVMMAYNAVSESETGCLKESESDQFSSLL